MSLHLYSVTGNVTPSRLGKLFPTGWTPVVVNGRSLVAAMAGYANERRGSDIAAVGTIALRDVVAAQVSYDRWAA